ncbi:hypothetical protein LB505_008396 [Fusarium chuoi]|nr:hypothetical protein LB505_008396 [Fusarium chuoi]
MTVSMTSSVSRRTLYGSRSTKAETLLSSRASAKCSRNGGWGDKPQWQGFSTAKGIRGTVFNTAQPDKAGIILGMIYVNLLSCLVANKTGS